MATADTDTVLSIRVPRSLLKAFDAYAETQGRKRQDQIRWVMRQAISQAREIPGVKSNTGKRS